MKLLAVHELVERVHGTCADLVELHLRELHAKLTHLEQRGLEGIIEDEEMVGEDLQGERVAEQ